ncbi:MAG: ribbon-helix-helix protein, CopG family [Xanthobacteraceae bacterium]|nr:ribbon-helix-helix protein, CopG family [Xanthobacteraceae bacterium]
MNRKMDVIEVDKDTAETLKARAADRGISVAELLNELARQHGPVAVEPSEIAELDRRWATIEAGGKTVQNADVVRWLETWGSPDFKPWPQ